MKVIITSCKHLSYWYRCHIGETYEVIDSGTMDYLVLDNSTIKSYIGKEDCITVDDHRDKQLNKLI